MVSGKAELPPQSLHLSFDNQTYLGSENVYVWFTGQEAGLGATIGGSGANLLLNHSYALSELSAGVDVTNFISGRIYFSLGGEIGGTQPTLDAPFRFDFMEITYNGQTPNVADLSAMDQFGIPLTLQLKKNGQALTGPNTFAGWKGNTDQQIVAALSALSPEHANIKRDAQGNFLRILGATDIHHRDLYSPQQMEDYVSAIRASPRTIIIKGTEVGGYEYHATFDGEGNWVLTKVAGNGSDTIYLHASTKWGPNEADPALSIAEQIFASDPKISLTKEGPIFSASDMGNVPQASGLAVRDLFAALNLGYINSDHVITAEDLAAGGDLGLIGKKIGDLSTDQMRDHLKVAFDVTGEYYNYYALEVQKLSDAYGYAYSDWNEHLVKVALLPAAPHGGVYADELNIGIYATDLGPVGLAVPEPSTWLLLGMGSLFAVKAFLSRRRSRAA